MTLVDAFRTLHNANMLPSQQAALPEHLRPLLKHPISHLDNSDSVAFIASTLWFGTQDRVLAEVVTAQCFHSDQQSRRIVGIVQAYGCGKTKTALHLVRSFIVLPVRFNFDSTRSATLIDNLLHEQKRLRQKLPAVPSFQDVQQFSERCLRLVHLFLFILVALYDHCVSTGLVEVTEARRTMKVKSG
ncbi:hypothetical protein HKX48_000619 [Thoreauomyces humboldtii]|nr:hypothetical protein HKX48_000619 [Thoreauomyces humboldtii]